MCRWRTGRTHTVTVGSGERDVFEFVSPSELETSDSTTRHAQVLIVCTSRTREQGPGQLGVSPDLGALAARMNLRIRVIAKTRDSNCRATC